MADEAMDKFHARVTPLDSQEAFRRLSTANPRTGRRELAPGFYITSYTQLTGNGVTPFPEFDPANVIGMMQVLALTDADSSEFFDCRAETYAKHYHRLDALDSFTLRELQSAAFTKQKLYPENESWQDEVAQSLSLLEAFHCDKSNPAFSDLAPEKKQIVRARMTEARYTEYSGSVGESHWLKPGSAGVPPATSNEEDGCSMPARDLSELDVRCSQPIKIKCVYSPSLADLCQDSFGACAVDEGVRMKGEETIIGTGVRQINSRFKTVLTATPIKNRLPDVFRLAWWATGARPEAHARFPYPDATSAREEFANEFLVSERNLTKEKEKPQRYKKLTPQVCNVHRLWKMFAPIILRRRKADFGEDIVAKQRHVVRAPLGTEQAAVYRFHLKAKYTDKNGCPAIGAQLQALRVASANPVSELLIRPFGDGKTKGEPRSTASYIPKLHSALKLIHQILERGEQVIVFSAFHDSLDVLSARLTEAGVAHCLADGRTSQKRRGALAAQFKLGPGKSPHPVMLAGVECMSEGHSFHLCNNVILLCYSWAYDKFEQAINRVHRLNSRWPVNIYPIICDRSIDRKLEAMIQEKGDAAELVLDGRLQTEQSSEINLAELLDIARKEFDAGGKLETVDEHELEKEWPPLRSSLSIAAANWRVKGFALCGEEESTPVIELPSIPASREVAVSRFNPTRRKLGSAGVSPALDSMLASGPEGATARRDVRCSQLKPDCEDLLLWQLAAN
jgi:hypothetical protein